MSGNPGAIVGPVAWRDLFAMARSWRVLAAFMVYLAVLATIGLSLLAIRSADPSAPSTGVGFELLEVLATTQVLLLMVAVPLVVGSSIARDMARGAWEMLLASPLSSWRILWGKTVSALTYILTLVLAPLPLYGLASLYDDAPTGKLIPVVAVLLATAVLLASVSLVLSWLLSRPTAAAAAGIAVGLAIGPCVSLLLVLGIDAQSAAAPAATPRLFAWLSQIDPLAALASALPPIHGHAALGQLATVGPSPLFGGQLALWQSFAMLAVAVSCGLLALTTAFLRRNFAGLKESG
jgi:ABC-type transport system involved in multi-copper enzyme maturation permease subunit